MLKSGIYDFVICRGGTDMCFVVGFGRQRPDLKQYRISGLTITDPWSKGDYSRHIREASMAMDGLPEGVSPSGRVPEHLLQEAPILKRRRRRHREGFTKKGSVPKGFRSRGKYRRRGESGGPTGQPGGPLVVALLPPLGSSGRF